MPQNKKIHVRCSIYSCYWNVDDKEEPLGSNCASLEITLTDGLCNRYISKEEAERRLKKSSPER